MESLVDQSEIAQVGFGWAALYWPKPKWDVLHIQWPEALVGWQAPEPANIESLRCTLERARTHASIIVTVHNYNAREWMGALGHQLYESVYTSADAFVHLGRRSLEWFLAANSRFGWCNRAIHEVIGHGDYSFYNRVTEDDTLVTRLASATTNFLVFGRMRRKEEMLLAETAFDRAQLQAAKLIFAGKVEPDAKAAKRSVNPNIIRYHRRIAEAQVKPLVQASKFVFVPRGGRLNSGVIPLAFTFGIPVIAPHEGVMGEIVDAVENISFIPNDLHSAAEALRRAYFLSDEEYRAMSNRVLCYCEENMDWPTLARQHVALYARARAMHVDRKVDLGERLRMSREPVPRL
jgi:hypothetical protein